MLKIVTKGIYAFEKQVKKMKNKREVTRIFKKIFTF